MGKFKSYQPIHTTSELTHLVEGILGGKVTLLKRQNIGEVNAVYFLTTTKGELLKV